MKYQHKTNKTIINLSDYEEVKETSKNWKPSVGEKYFFVDLSSIGRIRSFIWGNNIGDIFAFNTLNCFRTEQEAEAYLGYLLAVGKVTRRIWELNGNVDSSKSEILGTLVDELNLPTRVINTLLRSKIKTIGNLTTYSKTDLINLKGIGLECVREIEGELKRLGLELNTYGNKSANYVFIDVLPKVAICENGKTTDQIISELTPELEIIRNYSK